MNLKFLVGWARFCAHAVRDTKYRVGIKNVPTLRLSMGLNDD